MVDIFQSFYDLLSLLLSASNGNNPRKNNKINKKNKSIKRKRLV